MMRSLVLLLCLFVFQAFADPYTITKFSGEDVGSPDDFIAAEFGGTLKISSSGSVQGIQNGRLSVRQKFEDPFGEEETTYQLYEGRKGPSFSDLKAFAPPAGMSYEKLGKAKVFTSKTATADMDVEKVYFDGQAVYAEGASSLFVNYNSQMVELKPAGPAAPAPVAVPVSTPAIAMPVSTPAVVTPAVPSVAESTDNYGSDDDSAMSSSNDTTTDDDEDTIAAPKPVVAPALALSDNDDEDCTDDDEDCEEYDVVGDVAATNKAADESDYSASDAANDVTNRFGIADEVRKWSAWGLVAVAAGGAVVGVMQHMEYSDAKDAYDKSSDLIDEHKKSIHDACNGDTKCETSMLWYYSQPEQTLYNLEQKKSTNKKTMDSYALYRNIWFGVTAASLTGAIVLFTW